MKVSIEVSVGELFDKITILRIKQKKLTDEEQLDNVNKELSSVSETYSQKVKTFDDKFRLK